GSDSMRLPENVNIKIPVLKANKATQILWFTFSTKGINIVESKRGHNAYRRQKAVTARSLITIPTKKPIEKKKIENNLVIKK
ncbi:hypothetical protein ABTN60_18685, partial [Acinetobacter baumannii]